MTTFESKDANSVVLFCQAVQQYKPGEARK